MPGTSLPQYKMPEAKRIYGLRRSLWNTLLLIVVMLLLVGAGRIARIDMNRLVTNTPKIALWVGRMFPPYDNFRKAPDAIEISNYLGDALVTVAIATIGTVAAAILGIIPAVLAARTLTPSTVVFYPVRWFLNALRGIDSFIFALFFVAAVGLGPFAGVLGVALHTWGSIAKLYAENLENIELAPMLALEAAGVSRPKALVYALLPDAMPSLISTSLYMWELNVRLSIALGIVGAGGIGQDVKNAIDLLNFPHLGVLLLIILVMVTIIDQMSTQLRRLVA